MSTYIVSGRKETATHKDFEVEALTEKEAVSKFKEKFPEHVADYIEDLTGAGGGKGIVGQDEHTLEYIFEGDQYWTDHDGCHHLRK